MATRTDRVVTPAPSPSVEALPTLSTTAVQAHGTESPSLPLATLTVVAPQTYRDADLGFGLHYEASWHLDARSGTALNDGSGRTVILERDGYQLKMMIQNKPRVVGVCAGLLRRDARTAYWEYAVDDLRVWRAKAEAGFVNGYHDDQRAFIDIIAPALMYDKPTQDDYIGEYTCSLEAKGKVLSISYVLPVSANDLKAGQFRADILAEMDYILTSISLK